MNVNSMIARAVATGTALAWLAGAPDLSAAVVVQIGHSFSGATLGVDSDALPPDGGVAVGLNHVVEFINGRFSVFTKATGQRVKSSTDLAFWKTAGITLAANLIVSDPRVVFDPASQRWFASQIDVNPSQETRNRFLLAVSVTADPTGSWKAVAFVADPDTGNFADFPTLGVDASGVYLSGDMFSAEGSELGSLMFALPKEDLLADPPSVAGRTSSGLLNYSDRGYILQPTVASGSLPARSDEVVVAIGSLGTDFQSHSTLMVFPIHNVSPGGGATWGAPKVLTVPAYTVPINPPQPQGVTNLDNGDGRIGAIASRVGDVIYAVHGVQVNDRAALQWFKLNAVGLTLLDTGIISDSRLHLYYSSIAANDNGVVIIGCNGSSATSYVSAYAFLGQPDHGRLAFGPPVLLKSGTAAYDNADSSGISRWGDYSAVSVDPVDPTHFWTVQIIATGTSTWATQIVELIVSDLSLRIDPFGTQLRLSWPTAAAGFHLETSADPSSSIGWTRVTSSPSVSSGRYSVVVPGLDPQAFYRLTNP